MTSEGGFMKKVLILSLSFVFLFFSIMSITYASAAGEISAAGTRIIKVLLWLGYAIALGMLIFIGIKYILGSADAKASMKKSLTGWIIGAVIILTTTTIIGAVLSIVDVDGDTSTQSLAEKIVGVFKLD